MFQVTKQFSFDAAHRLAKGYQGKCANIHGHTWQVRVTATAFELNHFGFVRDFSDFKPLKDWLDVFLDHGTILCSDDKEIIEFLESRSMKRYVMKENPTSENLCLFLYGICNDTLKLPVTRVEVDETCTCRASYEPIGLPQRPSERS